MKYTIYKTINKINGKFYIGKHQTETPNDNYLGSGKLLKAAIKKYGINNFEKRILFIFDSEEEMELKEKEILTEDFVSMKNNYNVGIGGEGGAHFKGKKHSTETKKSISLKNTGRKLTEESKRKISENNSLRKISEETKAKLSKKAKERFLSEEERSKISNGVKKSITPERLKKISEAAKEREKIKKLRGREEVVPAGPITQKS